jgi:hypothetical protein
MAGSATAADARALQQVGDVDGQPPGDAVERRQRHVYLAGFDLPVVPEIEPEISGELLLGHPPAAALSGQVGGQPLAGRHRRKLGPRPPLCIGQGVPNPRRSLARIVRCQWEDTRNRGTRQPCHECGSMVAGRTATLAAHRDRRPAGLTRGDTRGRRALGAERGGVFS